MKLFLVEDEVIIRNGIKNSIDWGEVGIDFVGEASDGELAYPLILKEKPDILITDIKMPFMDGLELSALVRKELPHTKILIISGYSDFEYAKKAISIGVTDYLLKPVSAQKLLETIEKIKKDKEKQEEEQGLVQQFLADMKENTEYEKLKFFNQLVQGNLSISQILDKAKNFEMTLNSPVYRIMLFKWIEHEIINANDIDAFEKIEQYLDEGHDSVYFRRGVEGWAILWLGKDSEMIDKKVEQFKAYADDLVQRVRHLQYFGGVGSDVYRLSELKKSFHEADRIFANRFVSENNQILNQVQLHIAYEKGDIKESGIQTIESNRILLNKFLRSGILEEVASFIDVYFGGFPEDNLKSTVMRQYIVMDIYVQAFSFVKDIEVNTQEIATELEEMKYLLERILSLDEIKEFMTRLISRIVELRDQVAGRGYVDIVKKAKKYINEYYMSNEISLNKVAEIVNMSPSYFSSIFRKETGQTFVEYLTEIRMEKAKELLVCSNQRTSEIGFTVGYKEAHYFSYIFKKTQNCSPKEYRLRRRANEAKPRTK